MPWIQQQYNISDGQLEYNIYEGTFECHAPGKKAFVDSRLNCWLFQLPFILENFGFGYICFGLIIPIMLISIFGKIKHSYRWFILNQAFWDFFIIYNFICDKPTWNTWFKSGYVNGWFKQYHTDLEEWLQSINQRPPTCFYSFDEASMNNWFKHILSTLFYTAATNASFAPLFLLTFSRFLCLYYHRFYESFATKKFKIILIIVGFNAFCVAMVNLDDWYTVAAKIIIKEDYEKCAEAICHGKQPCNPLTCVTRFYNIVYTPYLKVIQNFLPPLTLIITNILGIGMIIKIVRQFKYQAKHNRYNLINSLKIACIILFQCFTMTFLFVISVTENILIMLENFHVTTEQTLYETWPSWIRFLTLASTIQSVNIIRIFLDSCIVLCLLSDYHEVVVESARFIIVLILHPKMTFIHVKKQLLNRKFNSDVASQFSTRSRKVVPLSMISREK